ncbi:MAG: hypothetical protein IJ593_05825 [Lachnospiraceae bacterium]|nr:hypothetical protein [Lachnospiraceae bacterium]
MSATIELYKVKDIKDGYNYKFKVKRFKHHYMTKSHRAVEYREALENKFKGRIINSFTDYGDRINWIPTDSVHYRQGWYFNKHLFDCKFSLFLAFNKKDAIKIMDMLIDKSKKWGKEAYDTTLEKINELENNNEEFILEIAW